METESRDWHPERKGHRISFLPEAVTVDKEEDPVQGDFSEKERNKYPDLTLFLVSNFLMEVSIDQTQWEAEIICFCLLMWLVQVSVLVQTVG